MVAAKVTAKGVGTPFDELANQASVIENAPKPLPAAECKSSAEQKSALSTAWGRVQGFFTGILVAIITTMYMVRSTLWALSTCAA